MKRPPPVKQARLTASKGPHLSAIQFAGGPVLAYIQWVEKGGASVRGTPRSEEGYVIRFQGWQKTLFTTARRNWIFLCKMYPGEDSRAFEGKPIYLYRDPTAKFGGEAVGGIRLALGDAYSGDVPPNGPTPVPRDSQPGVPDDEPPEIETEVVDPETGEVEL